MSFFRAGLTQTTAIQADEDGGELASCFCLTSQICYFKVLFSAIRFKMLINIWTCQCSFAYTWGIQKNAEFNCSKFFQKGCKKSKFFTRVFLSKNQDGHFWRS